MFQGRGNKYPACLRRPSLFWPSANLARFPVLSLAEHITAALHGDPLRVLHFSHCIPPTPMSDTKGLVLLCNTEGKHINNSRRLGH